MRNLSHALAPTPMDDLEGRYVLLLAREKVDSRVADHTAQALGLAALEEIAPALADLRRQVKAALQQAQCAGETSNYPQSIPMSQRV